MFDGILRITLPKGAQIVGFADDIALVIREKHFDELVRRCNSAVGRVRRWIAGTGL